MKVFLLIFLLATIISAKTVSTAQVITTYVGGGSSSSLGDGGPATAASIGYVSGIAFDAFNNLYIADGNNNRIRKVDAITNIITTFAGNGISGFSGDGNFATNAELNDPDWVTTDKYGNLYISDGGNNRIRKVSASGIITTYAGNGSAVYSGDNGPAINASLNGIQGICTDTFGNLFIADGATPRIRKVDVSGVINTVAGNGIIGYSGDGGPATAAEMNFILGICLDIEGNIYVADASSERIRIVNKSSGIISTEAGNGTSGYAGDGNAAILCELNWPFAVAIDEHSYTFIADYSNNRIRQIDNSGTIKTIVGTGTAGFDGDGGSATNAEINRPQGIAIDNDANIYIADFANKRIRKVTFTPNEKVNYVANKDVLLIYPNPAYYVLDIDNIKSQTKYYLYSMVGAVIGQGTLKEGNNSINVAGMPPGVYMLAVVDKEGNKTVKKIVKE
jgi:sugar lactone lactonase YvrE